jgi:hypothetical protein
MNPQNTESFEEAPAFFKELMDQAGKLYRQKVNKESLGWYWAHLRRFSQSKLVQAFNDCFEREEFFPSIATIRKYIPQEPTKNQPFPGYDDVKGVQANQLGTNVTELIIKKMNREISEEEFINELLRLEKEKPNLIPMSFKQVAEIYRLRKRIV